MSPKTLVNLAQSIERKISHPEEILRKKGTLACFLILSNGMLGLCYRRAYSSLNGMPIEKLSV
jgi:hypothetical protein